MRINPSTIKELLKKYNVQMEIKNNLRFLVSILVLQLQISRTNTQVKGIKIKANSFDR
jgi:hypothetical protein